MFRCVEDVADFHRACDVPVYYVPKIPELARTQLRKDLITEEVTELFKAMDDRDLPKAADAIVDSIYVLIGTALEYGIPLSTIWNIVQRCNMAKKDPITGKVIKREDGKVLKPEGWQPPDKEIERALFGSNPIR